MIFSPSNEPVEIISGPYRDLLDPTSTDFLFVDIRFLEPPQEESWARICRLHADGGRQEIDEAINKVRGVVSVR